MGLQWTSVQPTEPGLYWAAIKGLSAFGLLELAEDGNWYTLPDSNLIDILDYDLWSWPVEVPPAPVREPAKDDKDANNPSVSTEQ